MSKKLLRSLIAGTALVFALSVIPAAVLAEEGQTDDDQATAESAKRHGQELKSQLQELKVQRQEARQQKLEDAKLRACQNRKDKIAAIMTRSIARAERQLALFDTIAERVKAFYAEKGRTVANYDELVAAVDAAKADAEANLETLKGLEAFDCDVEDPKGDIEAFKLALKSINEDLKAYRTAVKDLIVGVKSAQSDAARAQQDQEEGEE